LIYPTIILLLTRYRCNVFVCPNGLYPHIYPPSSCFSQADARYLNLLTFRSMMSPPPYWPPLLVCQVSNPCISISLVRFYLASSIHHSAMQLCKTDRSMELKIYIMHKACQHRRTTEKHDFSRPNVMLTIIATPCMNIRIKEQNRWKRHPQRKIISIEV
jgi:hypothetical protein